MASEKDMLFGLIEAMAEAVSYFYDCLLEEGFESEQAMRLCVAYLESMSGETGKEG